MKVTLYINKYLIGDKNVYITLIEPAVNPGVSEVIGTYEVDVPIPVEDAADNSLKVRELEAKADALSNNIDAKSKKLFSELIEFKKQMQDLMDEISELKGYDNE